MAFYNKYPNRKDWRKPYMGRDPRAVNGHCQNHQSCPWCRANRLHKYFRQEPLIDDETFNEYAPQLQRLKNVVERKDGGQ